MGEKRPIKSQIVAKYGKELAEAERMAQAGFNKKTKKLDESIYGPSTIAFDPLDDLKQMQQNNITDGSFLEAIKGGPPMGQESLINNALDAVQIEDPSFQMPPEVEIPMPTPLPPIEEEQEVEEGEGEEEEEEDKDAMPTDPEEKIDWVAKKLAELKGPNCPKGTHIRQWKQMHGNVFVLQIDESIWLYRYLKRQEWAQIQANPAFGALRTDQQEDYISQKCVLWPPFNPETQGGLPAGASTMLSEQIKIQSMFLDPVQVASITVKL